MQFLKTAMDCIAFSSISQIFQGLFANSTHFFLLTPISSILGTCHVHSLPNFLRQFKFQTSKQISKFEQIAFHNIAKHDFPTFNLRDEILDIVPAEFWIARTKDLRQKTKLK